MNIIVRLARGTRLAPAAALAALTGLAACGGGSGGSQLQEIPVVSQDVYVYNPNAKHRPVSLSGADLVGLEPIVR
ncbi:hypothetical protein [uncultured Paracoccus sp.]|uniref:hypothetical protein n=1 Tax=uncultured Paracoccus sp. TaxID=189685 RepID=UPI00261AD8B1|nr:hypothetical protein [uncultured Paracoccus sp.]